MPVKLAIKTDYVNYVPIFRDHRCCMTWPALVAVNPRLFITNERFREHVRRPRHAGTQQRK